MEIRMQRSGVPLVILAAVVLIGALAAVYLMFWPLGEASAAEPERAEPEPTEPEPTEQPSDPAESTEPADTAETVESAQPSGPAETDAEAAEQGSVDPDDRAPIKTHTVSWGDNFFVLAGRYWGDAYLWPDLYAANANTFADPDFMLPGQRVNVPQSLLADGELDPADVAVISDAHLTAYERYRRLGEQAIERGRSDGSQWLVNSGRLRINKSHWVLYSGLRYAPQLLDRYAERIRPEDRETVAGFVRRFGPPPPVD